MIFFLPDLILVVFLSILGPIYALSSIISPSASQLRIAGLYTIYCIKYTGILYYKYYAKDTSIQSGQCEPVRSLPFIIHVPGWMRIGRSASFHEYACWLQKMLHRVCRHMSDNQSARQTAKTRKSRQ